MYTWGMLRTSRPVVAVRMFSLSIFAPSICRYRGPLYVGVPLCVGTPYIGTRYIGDPLYGVPCVWESLYRGHPYRGCAILTLKAFLPRQTHGVRCLWLDTAAYPSLTLGLCPLTPQHSITFSKHTLLHKLVLKQQSVHITGSMLFTKTNK